MDVKEIKAVFIERISRTPSIDSFRFLPKERLKFIPGQFLEIVFDQKNLHNKELNKYLSFSSSPTKRYIEVTKRISESAFSQRLKALKRDEEVLLRAPMGSCIFKEDYKRIAFLVGGIGITPVISILEYIMDKGLQTDVSLFYSNRTEEEIAFKKELYDWQEKNPRIKVFYTITDCQPEDSSCIYGQINKGIVIERMKDLNERKFFIFGPPGLVGAMEGLCLDIGCKREDIKIERFIGYA